MKPATNNYILSWTVHVGLMENNDWQSFEDQLKARKLYDSLRKDDNVSNLILSKRIIEFVGKEGVKVYGEKI